MSFNFTFKDSNGTEDSSENWVNDWSKQYDERNSKRYPDSVYEYLVKKAGRMDIKDICVLGAWKDAALKKGCDRDFDPKSDKLFSGRWKRNAASVARKIWEDAAKELGGDNKPDIAGDPSKFLSNWSRKVYRQHGVKKHFGLSRSSALLHFLSGGRYPILDSRVEKAIGKLGVQYDVACYVNCFVSLFNELASKCNAKSSIEQRRVDKALFAYSDS